MDFWVHIIADMYDSMPNSKDSMSSVLEGVES